MLRGTASVAEQIGDVDDDELTAEMQQALKQLSAESKSQTDDLIELARKNSTLFHNEDQTAYVSITEAGHHETHIINRSGRFKTWLRRQYFTANSHAPSSQPLNDAIATLEAIALFDGVEAPVFHRVGEHDGATYLDLCNENFEVVRITPNGWDVLVDPPIYFRRASGARPLPVPVLGGSVDQLRDFVNVDTDEDFILLLVFLLAALRPHGPYGILSFAGEQGSAKSTTMRVIRALIDPNKAPIRSPPRSEEDLVIAATHSWALAYDNLSGMPVWLSDGLCRIATGGGYGKRTLYTTEDETIFDGQRPVMINSIEDIVDRDDLRDRSLCLTLPTISDSSRKDERTFWGQFEQTQPAILGALLTLTAKAMAELPGVTLEASPRMADLARFGVAVERAGRWEPDRFLKVYKANRDEADARAIEDNLVASLVRDLVQQNGVWTGTATKLLARLNQKVDERILRSKDWPQTGRGMSGRLRRVAPALRRVGIHIYHLPRSGNERIISITGEQSKNSDTPQGSQKTVTTVTLSQSQENRGHPSDDDETPTIIDQPQPSQPTPTVTQPSPVKANKNGRNDGHDDHDGHSHTSEIYEEDELGPGNPGDADYERIERAAIQLEGNEP